MTDFGLVDVVDVEASALLYSLGVSPRYDISCRELPNRVTSPISANTAIAVTVSTPRKQRSSPTASR